MKNTMFSHLMKTVSLGDTTISKVYLSIFRQPGFITFNIFQYFGSHSPTVAEFPESHSRSGGSASSSAFFGLPDGHFQGEEKGGNPQLLWSLVAILGITEIGNPFFKMYPLVMADIAMENDP